MPSSRFFFSAATAALCLLATSPIRAQSLSSQDRKFIEDAAKGGKMEVEMGNLGKQKGASQGVKDLSQKLIDDHTKANNQLMSLAQKKGVNLPAESPALPSSLTSKSGTDFDKAFAKDAVEDHQKDIQEFKKEAASGSDPDVKNWATQQLPVLQSHLDMAKSVQQ